MKMKVSVIAAFLLFLLPNYLNAQSGCVIYYGGGAYDNKVYTNPTGSVSYCNGYLVQAYKTTSSINISSTCKSNPFPDNYRQCIVGGSCGVLLQNYVIVCSIDDYVVIFLILMAVVSYFFIFKSKLSTFTSNA